jgi:glutathione S-transferase
MILIGRYRSPFVRRTGIVLKTLGMAFETKNLNTAEDTAEIRKFNPVGRVPSLVLDGGEVLIDSQAIIDYALEVADPEGRLLAKSGPNRRAVLRIAAIGQGAMDKAVASAYERNRRPKDKVFPGWVELVDGQVVSALAALEALAASGGKWMHDSGMSLADINAVVAFDQVSMAEPYLMSGNPYPALADLSARCNQLPAFAETRWTA